MEDFLRVMQALNDKSRLEILMFLKAQEDMLCVWFATFFKHDLIKAFENSQKCRIFRICA